MYCFSPLEEAPSIRERVQRDVYDSHDESALGKIVILAVETENEGLHKK